MKHFLKLCFRRFDVNWMFSILMNRWNKNLIDIWLGSQIIGHLVSYWQVISFHKSIFGSNDTSLINEGKNRFNNYWDFVFKGFGKFFNWFSFSLRSTDLLFKSSFCLVGINFFRIFWLRLKARLFYHWGLFFKSSTFRV